MQCLTVFGLKLTSGNMMPCKQKLDRCSQFCKTEQRIMQNDIVTQVPKLNMH